MSTQPSGQVWKIAKWRQALCNKCLACAPALNSQALQWRAEEVVLEVLALALALALALRCPEQAWAG